MVRDEDRGRDHDHRPGGRLHPYREPFDDVGRMPGAGGAGDHLHRRPARARVVLGDRDEQERDDQADQRRDVEVPEAEAARRRVEGHHDRDEPESREHRRDADRLVERVHDRPAPAHPGEERADHRGEDRHPADRDREEPEAARGEGLREQHHRNGCHGVGLEQVGRHPGAVADVVAHVVGDHCRVPRIVLRNPGLDLADEVGPDVGRLRIDAAAEASED